MILTPLVVTQSSKSIAPLLDPPGASSSYIDYNTGILDPLHKAQADLIKACKVSGGTLDGKTCKHPVPVNSGDTLTSIAAAHGTTWQRIYDANPTIADPSVITPGEAVVIPTATQSVPDRTPAVSAPIADTTSTTSQTASVKATLPSGSHTDWMAAAGIASSDYGYVDYIVSHESGWQVTVSNSSGSSAYGLCQSLPGSKMATAGADWATNPVTQLIWCSSYAQSRYQGWAGAYSHWLSSHWW